MVAIFLGYRDVIIELTGYMGPRTVNDPKRAITIGQVIDDNPHRTYIVHIFQRNIFGLHLAPDTEYVLRPALDLRLDARLLKSLLNDLNQLFDLCFPFLAPTFELLGNTQVDVLAQVTQRQIF